jgi:hypothetical protein
MAVETSLVIRFQDEAAAEAAASKTVTAELDPNHSNNLDSEGQLKRTFGIGDQPVFLVHHDPSLFIESVQPSSGDVSLLGGPVSRTKEVEVSFPNEEEAQSISYYGAALSSIKWYGNACSFSISATTLTPTGGNFPSMGDAVFNVSYNKQYKLIPPGITLEGDEEYKILIVVTMGLL